MYEGQELTEAPRTPRERGIKVAGGALLASAAIRDEIDRLEVTVERLLDRLAPITLPDTERPSGDPTAAKRADADSDLTTQLNGAGYRLSLQTERLQRHIDRIDL